MAPIDDAQPLSDRLSVRWKSAINQYGEDVIALTVADMDLLSPPAVVAAVTERARQGAYGYTYLPLSYRETVSTWLSSRHHWSVPPAQIIYTRRVVEAVSAILEEFTGPGDGVLIHTPSYGPVTNLIEPLGRRLVASPLVLTGGRYVMDFEETERLLAEEAKVLVQFSPHNPTGRVWTADELTRLAEIAHRHDTLIISDDVHADLVHAGHRHIPIASLDDETAQRTVTITSPGKPFNLAGLEITNVMTANTKTLSKITDALNRRGLDSPTFFAYAALEAAYGSSAQWLDELIDHVAGNLNSLREAVRTGFSGVELVEPEGTYLAWLDCRGWTEDESVLTEWMRRARVALTPGTAFGASYHGFLRVNLAVPAAVFEEALRRLADATGERP